MNFSEVQLPSNRKFGFFFVVVFGVVGVYFFNKSDTTTSYVFFGLAGLFLIVTLVKSDVLLPLIKLWMGFGFFLGMIISPIVLGIIFFGLFAPISIVMRVCGRDELRLKLANRNSHWKHRAEDSKTGTFKNQF